MPKEGCLLPRVKTVFRGDSGFCRCEMFAGRERNAVLEETCTVLHVRAVFLSIIGLFLYKNRINLRLESGFIEELFDYIWIFTTEHVRYTFSLFIKLDALIAGKSKKGFLYYYEKIKSRK